MRVDDLFRRHAVHGDRIAVVIVVVADTASFDQALADNSACCRSAYCLPRRTSFADRRTILYYEKLSITFNALHKKKP